MGNAKAGLVVADPPLGMEWHPERADSECLPFGVPPARWDDMASLQEVMVELHDIVVTAPFAFGSQSDPHKPSWVLADVGASGLSLPDRDYYLKPEPRFKEAR